MTQELEYMPVLTTHTQLLQRFLTKSLKIITVIKKQANILATWMPLSSNAHHSLKKMLLESYQQELELEETWPISHLVLELPKLKEIKLRKPFHKLL